MPAGGGGAASVSRLSSFTQMQQLNVNVLSIECLRLILWDSVQGCVSSAELTVATARAGLYNGCVSANLGGAMRAVTFNFLKSLSSTSR